MFSGHCFVVLTDYLPPERSTTVIGSYSLFGYLFAQMCSLSDVDAVSLCGDLSNHMGSLNNYIADVDSVPYKNH